MSHGDFEGRYRVERELGSGGYATVYLAEDLRHHRRVAIKVLRPEVAAVIGHQRFVREIEFIARLTHPHIVPLHDSGTANAGLFYVMPHIEGETLRARLAREGRLSLDESLRLTREIASALGYAHRNGLVHRDVKPENILLADGMALLSDFGIARAVRVASESATSQLTALTTAGTVIGTLVYMAPEQITGAEVDARADLYALACVLYEMLAGAPPFTGARETLAYQHLATPPRPITELRPEVPARLGEALTRALSKSPADRYPTAARLMEALSSADATTVLVPATVTASERSAQLPRPRTRFIGRERELAECSRLMGETRLLTLTGMGGTGKTRLALQIADAAEEAHPDGAHFADLAPVSDPARVSEVIAGALGVREVAGRELFDLVCERIDDRRVLLLLDNCEHMLAACAEQVDRLMRHAPSLWILTTSREPLGVEGERVFALRPLEVPDETPPGLGAAEQSEAVRLFVDRARNVQPDFQITAANVAAICEICRRLDGIPLALELAATRVNVLSVDQIRARLDHRFRLLTAGSRSAVPRQQTLLATIQWSYDQLSSDEQAVFRGLSVFAGGWTLELAVRLMGVNRDEMVVIDLLAQLVNKSLVLVDRRGDEPRYGLLETVRQYADERLRASGEAEAAKERHGVAYLDLAERAYADRSAHEEAWSATLEAEHDNLAAALEHFRATDQERYLELAGALAWFWSARSHFVEGQAHVTGALERSAPAPARPARARALWGAALMRAWQGDVTLARKWMDDSLRMLRELDDRREIANALDGIGWTQFACGEDLQAYATFEECLRLQIEAGNSYQVARAQVGLAQMSVALDRPAEARPLAEQIIAFGQRHGDRRQEHFGWHFLADCALIEGRFEESLGLYRKSLVLARAIEDRVEIGFEIQGIAMSLAALGHRERAVRLAAAVEAEFHRIGAHIQVRFWNGLLDRFIGGARRELGGADRVAKEGAELPFERAIVQALADGELGGS